MDYLKGAVVLKPFESYFGNNFPRLCAVWDSRLGQIQKDIKVTGKRWKVGAKGVLSTTEGHKLQLALNNPLDTLVAFGVRLFEIQDAGSTKDYKMEITAEPPSTVVVWCEEFIAKTPTPTPTPA